MNRQGKRKQATQSAEQIKTIDNVKQAARDYLNHYGNSKEESLEIQRKLVLVEQGDRESQRDLILRLQHYFEEILHRPVREEILPFCSSYEGLVYSTYGWGILDVVLHLSPLIEEVRITAEKQVTYMERGNKKFLPYVPTWQEVQVLQQKLTNASGLLFHEKRPRLSGYLEKLKSRLTMFTYPYTRNPTIILRRFTTTSFSLEELRLQSQPTFDKKIQLLLEQQVYGRANVLVIGPMASGKTTLLISMLKLKNPYEDYITIYESEHEMRFADVWPGEVVELQNVEEIGISLENCFKDIYRTTANTVLIGEIREPLEAYHFVNAGIRGTDATIAALHERFPDKALHDLTDLVFQYGGRSIELTQERISRAVNFINSLKIRNTGHRYIDAIYTSSWNEQMCRVESIPLVIFNVASGEYEWTGRKIKRQLAEYMCLTGQADLQVLQELGVIEKGSAI
ncbi:ATPase, T2SS/T4P/T4SS family [Brevibacillus laterosporus]|uniref:ATPase, T2SS/T4P/T4SS family n=1 Tax=Brevibacillus laterosporus TaxID=1465 RepID=A0AAP3DGL9_BRELA|nr:ATPase, T2SS/T4P/T4SS family [Brevibacillus laterosporus]MCR8980949.1 ATPase, T2SS/T4P/T4SS family [Brevibacillus laterosporus]MCZ0808104.1 ATPase, T2SS/T4P/T4SS family [Brevibacillus laterosporus]MCZ0826296.1 ATPase, T2SS/T4P/T4SS family [Brevibacillus laterosporus]MCZ0850179.1 ATPase, T2SS/T4P/T4SS family [Brevibacillus laterosporus]